MPRHPLFLRVCYAKRMKTNTLVLLVAVILLAGGGWWYLSGRAPSFQNPGAAHYTYTNASSDTIMVEAPPAQAVVGKSFSVIGHARGTWFFEGSFPVQVVDQNGDVIGTAIATSTEDWMTTEMIPFRADLTVPASYIGPATIVLHKDNPSGLPEHDASLAYPITVEY